MSLLERSWVAAVRAVARRRWLLRAGALWLASSSCGRTDLGYETALGPATAGAGAGAMSSSTGGGGTGGHVNPGGGKSGGAGGQVPLGGAAGNGGSPLGGSPVGGSPALELRGAPLVFAPTARELGINVALVAGDPAALLARARLEGTAAWQAAEAPRVRADDVAEWRLSGLVPGGSYEYEVLGPDSAGVPVALYTGRAVTQRTAGDPFRFALLSDTHIGSDLAYSNQGDESVLQTVARELGRSSPDFVINLGDILDFHQFGFNDPPPSASYTRLGYLNYRQSFGDPLGKLGHFGAIGNWDGENGSFTAEEISRSRSQRLLYLPTPTPTTYPEGGSVGQDYYAFTWGDALFVVLNVMSYTPSALLLSSASGEPDDWTLGGEQLTWLRRTLENARSKWRFLFIHHAVGGAAGNEANSIYGRGGGQAAHVGEQAEVHQLMLDHGVQVFFYAHDHVFTDIVVEGVHYSALGNAGAIWTFSGSETGYTRYWEQSGWAQVDVSPEQLHVQYVAVGGEVLFDYSL